MLKSCLLLFQSDGGAFTHMIMVSTFTHMAYCLSLLLCTKSKIMIYMHNLPQRLNSSLNLHLVLKRHQLELLNVLHLESMHVNL